VPINKIAILGITGAGKSTLSRRIAERTGLPLFHMDALFWKKGWTEVPAEEYLKEHADILANNERWIIEGWLNHSMAARLAQADLIIYLDYPGWLCALHYIERWLKHRNVARPELPEDSLERFKFRRFFIILFRGERAEIEQSLSYAGDSSKIIRFTSPTKLEEYLKTASF
jgi:adenylate kinase family enzyme